MKQQLQVNILASTAESVSFDKTSTPLLVEAFHDRGHEVQVQPVEHDVPHATLLDCNVFVDRSPITDTVYFNDLALAYFRRRQNHGTAPVMVDNPFATMSSFDKRKTHALMPDLVPESYNLDGTNNHQMIDRFSGDEFVVIKDPFGWYGQGTSRLSPEEAHGLHGDTEGLVVQKFVEFEKGVGRLITLNSDGDFEVPASYVVIPDEWITSEGVHVERELVDCTGALYDFARTVSKRSGLYLNGIDYIENNGEYTLLEVNAVPNVQIPLESLGIDVSGQFVRHVERTAQRR